MPQVVSQSGNSGKNPKKSGNGVKLSGDVSELPKHWLISGGVILLLIVVSVLFFTLRTPPRPKLEHVPPPAGYPDMPPYNTKAWQQHPTPVSGMPSPEAMMRMNGGTMPKPPPGAND